MKTSTVAILLRAGQSLEEWKIRRDIRAVWATGFVDDVRRRGRRIL